MSHFKPVPRHEIEFTPLAEDVVAAIEAVYAKHRPAAKAKFFDCGNCDSLHVVIEEGDHLQLNVMESDWKRRSKQ